MRSDVDLYISFGCVCVRAEIVGCCCHRTARNAVGFAAVLATDTSSTVGRVDRQRHVHDGAALRN